MFRPEHIEALRHQIRSLNAAQLPKDHPFAGDFNVTIGDQAKLLEEIRIEIHNHLLGRPSPIAVPDVNKRTIPQMRDERAEDRANGILHT